jgi:NAD(P)-dependent dehydrogenase (short-subunit alcohol dehydrogenase family)
MSDILGMTYLLRTLRPGLSSPFEWAYVAAKNGMLGLTQVTALETADAGITCSAICPGYVYASLVEAQIEARRSPRASRASK